MALLQHVSRSLLASNWTTAAPQVDNDTAILANGSAIDGLSSDEAIAPQHPREYSVPALGVIGVMSAMCILAVIFLAYGLFSRAEAIKDEYDIVDIEMHGALFSHDHDGGGGGGSF